MLQRDWKSGFVQHIGYAARHARREIAAGRAEHDDNAAGHVFAAVIADALDHRNGARVAHRKTFASDAAEIDLAGNRAIEHGIADDDRLFRHDLSGLARRVDHDAAARQALADIVIAFAFEFQRHAMGEPGAEALAGRALGADVDGVVRKAGIAVDARDFARQHGADGAIDAAHLGLQPHRRAALQRCGRARDQLLVERLVELWSCSSER